MSKEIELLYGDETIRLAIPDEKPLGVFEPKDLPAVTDPAACLREALNNPLGTPPLREVARGRKNAVVVVEDACRPTPDELLLDAVMDELVAAGMKPEQITVLVAIGLHRPNTDEEMDAILGKWKGRLRIENHDAKNRDRLTSIGTTSQGTPVLINSTFLEADLKVMTGDVEFHQFCGYGGGAKGVSPGLSDAETIRNTHKRMDEPGTGQGIIDGNPVREEINEIGAMAGVDFNLSVALDDHHRIVAAVAGDLDASFRAACKYVDEMYVVDLPGRADLVIASPGGYPKDIELYQSQKAIEESSLVVRPRGDVLTVAECREGSGSKLFEEWMEEAFTPEDIVRRIKENFVMGGHKAYQVAREVQRANIYLYSKLPPARVRAWMMNPVRDVDQMNALIDKAGSVIILPQATLTVCRLPEGA